MKLPTRGWFWVKTVLSNHANKWIAVAFSEKCAYYLGGLNGTHGGSIQPAEIVEVGAEIKEPS